MHSGVLQRQQVECRSRPEKLLAFLRPSIKEISKMREKKKSATFRSKLFLFLLFATPWTTMHGILQARILEWVAVPFFRGSSQPRDWIQVSHIAGGFSTSWAMREGQEYWSGSPISSPVDLPDPVIELGSPALHMDSLPTEISRKPFWKILS